MKDQAEFDLEAFCDMLDKALTSDHPSVQSALRNLMSVTTIITSANPGEELVKGPFRRLVEDIKHLERRVNEIDSRTYPTYPTDTITIGDIDLTDYTNDYNMSAMTDEFTITLKK